MLICDGDGTDVFVACSKSAVAFCAFSTLVMGEFLRGEPIFDWIF